MRRAGGPGPNGAWVSSSTAEAAAGGLDGHESSLAWESAHPRMASAVACSKITLR